MLTPQQVQETTLERAVFGGYTLESVDDFLEPLTEDYITLYKENAVLKSKMRVLVEKLEEYRTQESAMNNAIVAAQKTCDDMIAETQRKCARMMNDAESAIREKSGDVDALVTAEEERLNRAKAAAADFICTIEAEVQNQLDALSHLKMMDLTVESRPAAPQRRAFDYEEAEQKKKTRAQRRAAAQAKVAGNVRETAPVVEPAPNVPVENSAKETPNREPKSAGRPAPAPQPGTPAPTATPASADSPTQGKDIADEIKQSLERLMGGAQPAPKASMGDTKIMEPIRKNKFDNLQFGKNYDPTK